MAVPTINRLREIVDGAIRQDPPYQSRILKAATILATRAIIAQEDGSYTVQSEDGLRGYTLSAAGVCECYDQGTVGPGNPCKHGIAVRLELALQLTGGMLPASVIRWPLQEAIAKVRTQPVRRQETRAPAPSAEGMPSGLRIPAQRPRTQAVDHLLASRLPEPQAPAPTDGCPIHGDGKLKASKWGGTFCAASGEDGYCKWTSKARKGVAA
jgi:hypothetical protein